MLKFCICLQMYNKILPKYKFYICWRSLLVFDIMYKHCSNYKIVLFLNLHEVQKVNGTSKIIILHTVFVFQFSDYE